MLTKQEWDKFFYLLDKIVNEEKSVDEKIEQILIAAKNDGEGADTDLEEFLSWDFGYQ